MFVQEKKGTLREGTSNSPNPNPSTKPVQFMANFFNEYEWSILSDGMHQTEIRVSILNPSLIWNLNDGQQRKLQAHNSRVENPIKGGFSYTAVCHPHGCLSLQIFPLKLFKGKYFVLNVIDHRHQEKNWWTTVGMKLTEHNSNIQYKKPLSKSKDKITINNFRFCIIQKQKNNSTRILIQPH